jgi:hypothetical protein
MLPAVEADLSGSPYHPPEAKEKKRLTPETLAEIERAAKLL